jgi:hypothetical protein
MSAFDALDAVMMSTSKVLFGDLATLYPMKPGPAGVNGSAVADTGRAILTNISVIRSEWAERVQLGGNGMPMPPGAFKVSAGGMKRIATVQLSDLDWQPVKGDELEYADRPGQRYRIAELLPDGGVGLHLGLNKV